MMCIIKKRGLEKKLFFFFFALLCPHSILLGGDARLGSPEEISAIVIGHMTQAQKSIVGFTTVITNQKLCQAITAVAQKNIPITLFFDPSAKEGSCLSPDQKNKKNMALDWMNKKSGATLTGQFFIIDDHTVLSLSELWRTDRGNTERGTLIISTDSDIVSGFRKEFQSKKSDKKQNGENWSYGPIKLTINNKPISRNPFDLTIDEEGNGSLFLRVHATGSSPWKKVTLTLESNPPLTFVDKSGRGKNRSPQQKLVAKPISLFGPLRSDKPWLVMVGVKKAKQKKYSWSYQVESKSGLASGAFDVVFKKKK